jgi:hypothetical protein
VKSFFDWYSESFAADERWLILGKGPSYSRLADLDHRGMRLVSLNHVVRERKVDVAHVIDLDVIDACGESFLKNAGVLVMPWIPHVKPARRRADARGSGRGPPDPRAARPRGAPALVQPEHRPTPQASRLPARAGALLPAPRRR